MPDFQLLLSWLTDRIHLQIMQAKRQSRYIEEGHQTTCGWSQTSSWCAMLQQPQMLHSLELLTSTFFAAHLHRRLGTKAKSFHSRTWLRLWSLSSRCTYYFLIPNLGTFLGFASIAWHIQRHGCHFVVHSGKSLLRVLSADCIVHVVCRGAWNDTN